MGPKNMCGLIKWRKSSRHSRAHGCSFVIVVRTRKKFCYFSLYLPLRGQTVHFVQPNVWNLKPVCGIHEQIIIYVFSKLKLSKFQWILRTKTSNVNFVGTFILLLFPQRANVGSCCRIRYCNWNPQTVSAIRKL